MSLAKSNSSVDLPTLVWSRKGRVTKRYPCPACQRPNWCIFDDTQAWLLCMRPAKSLTPPGWYLVKESATGGLLYHLAEVKSPALPPTALLKAAPVSQPNPATTHQIYAKFLDLLDLAPHHYAELADPTGKRQLTETEIAWLGVRSLPARSVELEEILLHLEEPFGTAQLLQTPGFVRAIGGGARQPSVRVAAGLDSLLIPVRNPVGLITGIRVRGNSPHAAKYYWLSSAQAVGPAPNIQAGVFYPLNLAELKSEPPGGQTKISQADITHFYKAAFFQYPPPTNPKVGLTEGEFKAFIAAQKLGYPFFSVPGVACWQKAGVVELAQKALAALGKAGQTVIYYDADKETNPLVAKAQTALAHALTEKNLQVAVAHWPKSAGKGIDDVLLAGNFSAVQLQPFTRENTNARQLPMLPFPVDYELNSADLLAGQYLPDIPLKKKVTLIRAPKGIGKTEMLARLRSKLAPQVSFLSIGHRVALLHEQSRRLDLDFYQDFKEPESGLDRRKLTACRKLVICVDSLIHLTKIERRDFLVLDEVEQLLRHLTGPTLRRKRRTVLTTLLALLQQAGKIIALDADLSEISYDFFCRLFGAENVSVINCDCISPNALPLVAYPTKNQLIAKLVEVVQNGEKAYVATNSREEALQLEGLLKKLVTGRRVACVTQANSATPEVRSLLQDLNTAVTKLDVLIASPTLGTGVDINCPHFDYTFILGVSKANTPADLLQQAARNRKAKFWHAWLTPAEFDEPTDPTYWRRYCIEKAEQIALDIGFDTAGERIAAPYEQTYLELWARVKALESAGQNRLAANFYAQAAREGHAISSYEVVPTNQNQTESEDNMIAKIKKVSRGVRQARRVEREAAILAAHNIDEKRYQKLSEQLTLSPSEVAECERYRLQSFYGRAPTPELLRLDERGHLRQAFGAYLCFQGRLSPQERDRWGWTDYERLLPDLPHATAQTYWRKLILTKASFDLNNLAKGEISTPQLQENGFVEWITNSTSEQGQERVAEQIYLYLGLRVKNNFAERPVELVSAVLGQLGLKLVCDKKGKRGCQVRRYRIDETRLAFLEELAVSREKLHEPSPPTA